MHGERYRLDLEAYVSDHPDAKENAMIPDLQEGDFPDDNYSCVPYIKGAFFLAYLEEECFGEEKFQ